MSTIDPSFTPRHVLQRMAEELARHEAAFVSVAEKVQGELEVNYHNRPSRSITARCRDGIARQIEICAVLRDPEKPMSEENWTFSVGVDAWQDSKEERLLWSKSICLLDNLPRSNDELVALLDNCWSTVLRVTVDDLSRTD